MTAQVCFPPAFIAEQFLLEALLKGKPLDPAQAHASAFAGCGGPRKAGCFAQGRSPGAASAACADPCGENFRRRRSPSPTQSGRPIDIAETAKEWLIFADVPGYSLQDLKVTVKEGDLIISGEASSTPFFQLPEGARVHRAERRPARSFSRTFELPDDVDINAIRAKVELGVLRVTIPKVAPPPKQQPVTIPIEDPMEAEPTPAATPANTGDAFAAEPVADPATDGAAAPPAVAAAGGDYDAWVEVQADAKSGDAKAADPKGKAPMEPEVAATVEAQLQELKMAADPQAQGDED